MFVIITLTLFVYFTKEWKVVAVSYSEFVFNTQLLSWLWAGGGVATYGIAYKTRCFTLNMQNRIWESFKARLFFFNICVLCMVGKGIAYSISITAIPLLLNMGISDRLVFTMPPTVAVVIVVLIYTQVNYWMPVVKALVRDRLRARGISPNEIACGSYIGLSDPSKSSFKKFFWIEEDVGMYWIKQDNLVYRGDGDQFDISRGQLLAVERIADAGGVAALGGVVDVILRFRLPDGCERRVRLHIEDAWTLRAKAQAVDDFAAMLQEWKEQKLPDNKLTRP